MRHEEFSLEKLMDYSEDKGIPVLNAIEAIYPGMTLEELTEAEEKKLYDEFGECDNCGNPMREFNKEWNDIFRGELCNDCWNDYGEEEDEE